MSAPSSVPYHDPLFTAEQLAHITGLNRNTVQGWIARYGGALSAIGIHPVAKGATRKFSIEQIGVLAVIRSAAFLQQAEGVLESLSEIADHASRLYEELSAGIRWEAWGADTNDRRPYLPQPQHLSHLEGVLMYDALGMFHVTDRPYASLGTALRDLKSFPLPTILLPVDEVLRNAWTRATFVAQGFDLAD